MLDQTLSVGLVQQPGPNTEVVQEILDHQGICYEFVTSQDPDTKYAIVLMPDFASDSYESARKKCFSEEGVIIVSNFVNLSLIRKCLAGIQDSRADRLDLLVNQEELKLKNVLKKELSSLDLPLVIKWFWPRRMKACCVLTHDVDWFTYSPFHRAVIEGPGGMWKFPRLIFESVFLRRDYGWNIPKIIEIQKKYGVRSSFYIQTSYAPSDLSRLRKSISLLKEEKFEIGLHGAHSSHENSEALEAELKAFYDLTGFFPSGIRYHILKFIVPDTWLLESKSNIQYDATFYYNRFFAFRSEICFPFHPFSEQSRFRVLELPTALMDWTLLFRKKRGSNSTKLFEDIKKRVAYFNGVLTVNFHNTYINEKTFSDIYTVHEKLLKDAVAEGFWIATARECVEWWKYRSETQVNPVIRNPHTVIATQSGISLVIEDEKYSIEYR